MLIKGVCKKATFLAERRIGFAVSKVRREKNCGRLQFSDVGRYRLSVNKKSKKETGFRRFKIS